MAPLLRLLGSAALLSSLASAFPRPDSAIGEPAVSAVDGVLFTESVTPTQSPGNSGGYSSPSKDEPKGDGYKTGSGDKNTAKQSPTPTETQYNPQGNQKPTTSPWPMPTYGSGSSPWGSSGYDDCVSQCMAKYGAPSPYKPPSNLPPDQKNGARTHTVIVAPSQGVLKFVPPVVMAKPKDVVKYVWNANVHTVTKSSALLPCNKTMDMPFTSGVQNKSHVFEQTVNDTSPVFIYCGVPGHCMKGMFGGINIPNTPGSPSCFSNMESNISSQNPDVGTYSSMTQKNCGNNSAAASWGGSFDMSNFPEWSHSMMAENILYMRNFLASNPQVLQDDGFIDLSAANSSTLMIPQDVSVALKDTSSSPSGSPSGSVTVSSSSPSAGAQQQQAGALKSGARLSLLSPGFEYFVVLATFFLL